MKCVLCDKEFEDRVELKSHVYNHDDRYMFNNIMEYILKLQEYIDKVKDRDVGLDAEEIIRGSTGSKVGKIFGDVIEIEE